MIDFAPLSQIEPEEMTWLWAPYIPRGKLTLLDGNPDAGKSLLTIDLAARLSRGGPMPGCTETFEPRVSILLNAEDGGRDTVRRRAEAAGADLDRLILVKSIDGRTPQLPDDIPYLTDLADAAGAAYLVIDPIMAFFPPKVAVNSDQCIRQALTPLVELAERTGLVVHFNRHLTKKEAAQALFRGAGSVGLIGAARSAMLLARHPADAELRVLAPLKSNLAERPPTTGFRIRVTDDGLPVIDWTGPVEMAADELCRRPQAVRPRDRAGDWLERELADGPRKARELTSAAFALGIPEITLKRAKKDLKVESHQHGTGTCREWYWYDPQIPWPKDAPFEKPDPMDRLRESLHDLGPLPRVW